MGSVGIGIAQVQYWTAQGPHGDCTAAACGCTAAVGDYNAFEFPQQVCTDVCVSPLNCTTQRAVVRDVSKGTMSQLTNVQHNGSWLQFVCCFPDWWFRVLALLSFALMILLNYAAGANKLKGAGPGEISALYPTKFTPAGKCPSDQFAAGHGPSGGWSDISPFQR